MTSTELRLDVPSEGNLLLVAGFVVFVAFQAFAHVHTSGIWLFISLGTVIAFALALEQRTVTITARSVTHERRIGPYTRRQRFDLTRPDDVKVEVFSFDSWDPHVAIHCGTRVFRVGWGLPEAELHALRDRIRDVIAGA